MPELGNCCLGKEVAEEKDDVAWPMGVAAWLNDELAICDWVEIDTTGGGGVGGFPEGKVDFEMLLFTGEIWIERIRAECGGISGYLGWQ